MNELELKNIVSNLLEESKELLFLFEDELNKYEKAYKPQSKFSTSILGTVYQSWYSRSMKVVRIILPERATEFESIYLPNLKRKELEPINYTINDFINGLSNYFVSRKMGLRLLYNQVDILNATLSVIDSKLTDIVSEFKFRLNEKEIESANVLWKNGFYRSSGAICGVLLEEFLLSQIEKAGETISKKSPSLGDLIQFCYEKTLIDIALYKKLLFLADIRNKCDHKRSEEPTKDEIESLIFETKKIISLY